MEKLSKVARYGVDGYGRQDIYRDDEGGEFVYHDDFEALEQRAEAAEAKLAELEKQEPVAITTQHQIDSLPGDYDCSMWSVNFKEEGDITLYTRPAPAVNVADLVPDAERIHNEFDDWREGWNACRAAILRNIEEAK